MKLFKNTQWITPVIHIVLSFGIALALWFGSYLISHGHLTTGGFVSFLTSLILLYTPLKAMGNDYKGMLMSFLAVEACFKILNTQPTILDRPGAIEMPKTHRQIKFNDVTFNYLP